VNLHPAVIGRNTNKPRNAVRKTKNWNIIKIKIDDRSRRSRGRSAVYIYIYIELFFVILEKKKKKKKDVPSGDGCWWIGGSKDVPPTDRLFLVSAILPIIIIIVIIMSAVL
jgi:hypothetical protein